MVLRKLLSVLRLIFSCVKLTFGFVFRWRSRSSRIGELPLTMPIERRVGDLETDNSPLQAIGPNSTGIPMEEWRSWSDEGFGVESKIAEYRQQRQNAVLHSTSNRDEKEPDFFGDMEPQLKPTKKLKLRDSTDRSLTTNLFEVRDNIDNRLEAMSSTNLGDMDTRVPSYVPGDEMISWDESALVDDSELDALERQRQRAEREAKHRERLAEHERRLVEKRRQLQQTGRGFANAVRGTTTLNMPP